MKLTVDRIEDDSIAVCVDENESVLNLPVVILPEGVREGSVICLNGEYEFELATQEENEKRHSNFLLAESLFDE